MLENPKVGSHRLPHRFPAGEPFPGFQKVEGWKELTQQAKVGEADES
jgi:hypothetical protein